MPPTEVVRCWWRDRTSADEDRFLDPKTYIAMRMQYNRQDESQGRGDMETLRHHLPVEGAMARDLCVVLWSAAVLEGVTPASEKPKMAA